MWLCSDDRRAVRISVTLRAGQRRGVTNAKTIIQTGYCPKTQEMEETSMFHKLIYQKKAALTEADARDFSTKDYTCVKLLLTKRGRPVAILESNDTKNWHWRVQYGFSTVVFPTYAEAMQFCRERFYELNGAPLNGGRV